MKISELKNAPEWLVMAKTENEDVEITPSGYVIWKSGNFLGGNFLGGNFWGGNFLGGDFLGGNFRGGNFRGGLMMPNCKWVYGQDCEGRIIIGCKKKTLEEWDVWFSGTEEFDTKRGTEDFKKIQACFEATKAYIKFLKS